MGNFFKDIKKVAKAVVPSLFGIVGIVANHAYQNHRNRHHRIPEPDRNHIDELERRKQEALASERSLQLQYQRAIEDIKQNATQILSRAREDFHSGVEVDKTLVRKGDESHRAANLKIQQDRKKFEEIEAALLTAFETGNFEKIEALLENKELLEHYPNFKTDLLKAVALTGKEEWLNSLKHKKKIAETKDVIEKETSALVSYVERKERAEKQAQQETVHERAVALIAFEYYLQYGLARIDKEWRSIYDRYGFDSKEMDSFRRTTEERSQQVQCNYENICALLGKPLELRQQQQEKLLRLIRKIFHQFKDDYEYQRNDYPVKLEIVILVAAFTAIEELKNYTEVTHKELWLKAAIVAAIAGEFARYQFEFDPERAMNSALLECEMSDVFVALDDILKIYHETASTRMGLFQEVLEKVGPKYNTRPKWKTMVANYLEIMQSRKYPIGDERILIDAKEKADKEDFEKRRQLQEKIDAGRQLLGKVAFKLYLDGTINKAYSIDDAAQRNKLLNSEAQKIYQTMDLNLLDKETFNHYAELSQIAEETITQVYPNKHLEPNVTAFKFDLLQVAFALAKFKALLKLKDTKSEETIAHYLRAAIFAGFIRKLFVDCPENYDYFRFYDKLEFGHIYYNQKQYEEINEKSKHFDGSSYQQHMAKYICSLFQYYNPSDKYDKEINNVLQLGLKPFGERAEHLKEEQLQKPDLLKQADLFGAFLQLTHEKEVPAVYDCRLFNQARRIYKVASNMRYPIGEYTATRRLVEAAIFDITLDNLINVIYDSWHDIDKVRLKRSEICKRVVNEFEVKEHEGLVKYQHLIKFAEEIIKQTFSQKFEDIKQIYKVFVIAKIALIHKFGLESSEAKNPLLIKAIIFTALARNLYNGRIESSLSKINEGNIWRRSILEKAGDEFLKEFDSKEIGFINFIEKFTDVFPRFRFDLNVEDFIKISQMSNSYRKLYLNNPKNRVTHLSSAYELCNLFTAYHEITLSGRYPIGDIQILKEAEFKAGLLSLANVKEAHFSLQPIAYMGERLEIPLSEVAGGQYSVISTESYYGQGLDISIQRLRNRAQERLSNMQNPLFRNMFLPEVAVFNPNPPLLQETSQTQIIPINAIKTLSFRVREPGFMVFMCRKSDSEVYFQEFYVRYKNLLKTKLRQKYQFKDNYKLRFNERVSGTVLIKQGDDYTSHLLNEVSKQEFTPIKPGPMQLTINLTGRFEQTITHKADVLPADPALLIRANWVDPDWKNVVLSSEKVDKGIEFSVGNEKLVRIDPLGGIVLIDAAKFELKQKEELPEADFRVLCLQYNARKKNIKQFFAASNSKDKMAKAILVCHGLSSKDLSFGPFYTLALSLFEGNVMKLEEPFLELLMKQIALYELMQSQGPNGEAIGPQKVAQFIKSSEKWTVDSSYDDEFPKYWSEIFSKTHMIYPMNGGSLALEAYTLLIMQTFLTVLKGEAIFFNAEMIFKLTQFLYAMRDKGKYKAMKQSLEAYFEAEPLYLKWLAEIHSRWGADLDEFHNLLERLNDIESKEELRCAAKEVGYGNAIGRERSQNIGKIARMIDQLLDNTKLMQEHQETVERTYMERNDQIRHIINVLQSTIWRCEEERREYIEAMHNARQHARHKANDALVKQILVTTATAIVTGPLANAFSTTTMGVSMASLQGTVRGAMLATAIEGSIAGAVRATLMGENILRGTLQGGAMHVIGQQLNTHIPIDSKFVREAVAGGTLAAIDTAIHGGRPIEVFGQGLGAGMAQLYLPAPQGPHNILSGMVTSMGRAAIRNEISSLSIHEESRLDWRTIASAGAEHVAGHLGQGLASQIQNATREARARQIQGPEMKLPSERERQLSPAQPSLRPHQTRGLRAQDGPHRTIDISANSRRQTGKQIPSQREFEQSARETPKPFKQRATRVATASNSTSEVKQFFDSYRTDSASYLEPALANGIARTARETSFFRVAHAGTLDHLHLASEVSDLRVPPKIRTSPHRANATLSKVSLYDISASSHVDAAAMRVDNSYINRRSQNAQYKYSFDHSQPIHTFPRTGEHFTFPKSDSQLLRTNRQSSSIRGPNQYTARLITSGSQTFSSGEYLQFRTNMSQFLQQQNGYYFTSGLSSLRNYSKLFYSQQNLPNTFVSIYNVSFNRQPQTYFRTRERFHLPSVFEDHYQNPFINSIVTVYGKPIERARDFVADFFVHPFDNMYELGQLAWDISGAASQLVLGRCTEGSRLRNQEQFKIITHAYDEFLKADSIIKMGMLVEFGSATILTGGIGSFAAINKIPKPFSAPQCSRTMFSGFAGPARQASTTIVETGLADASFSESMTHRLGKVTRSFGSSDSRPLASVASKTMIPSYSASNVNAQSAINTKLRALEKAQNTAVRTQEFSDGRIRYYKAEKPSRTPGPTRGASYVTEFNPETGQVRSWYELYDHTGNVNRVHPKMINGQDIIAPHYPPTGMDLMSSTSKFGGKR